MSGSISKKKGDESKKSTSAYLRSTIGPYTELMRLHKPVGILNIYFPYLFGHLFVCCTTHNSLQPQRLCENVCALFLFAFLLRSAGCTWNDIVDRDIDRLVGRTRGRPMARGAVSVRAGYNFTLVQVAIVLAVIRKLLLQDWALYTVPLVFLVWLYPFAKRFTDYAQVVLGVTLGWGVLIGAATEGINLRDGSQRNKFGLGALYVVYIVWTVIHDIIYAHQNVKDDIQIGVGSMAIGILTMVGVQMEAVLWFWIIAVGGNTLVLIWMILALDLGDPKDCLWWFQTGSLLVGLAISLGLLGEYFEKP